MPEQPVPLQQDTLTQLPGGGIRTITGMVMINDVPTQVQMQVVTIADPSGALLGDRGDDVQIAILGELREIRRVLSHMAGIASFENEIRDRVR
jgi:hypothetical protein